MQARSWLNRLHPQTLLSATMLLYIEGLFNLIREPNFGLLAMVGAAMFPAAWGLANDRRWGWRLGVVTASLAVIWRLSQYGLDNPVSTAFSVVLLALLLHPTSREHQRIWFR